MKKIVFVIFLIFFVYGYSQFSLNLFNYFIDQNDYQMNLGVSFLQKLNDDSYFKYNLSYSRFGNLTGIDFSFVDGEKFFVYQEFPVLKKKGLFPKIVLEKRKVYTGERKFEIIFDYYPEKGFFKLGYRKVYRNKNPLKSTFSYEFLEVFPGGYKRYEYSTNTLLLPGLLKYSSLSISFEKISLKRYFLNLLNPMEFSLIVGLHNGKAFVSFPLAKIDDFGLQSFDIGVMSSMEFSDTQFILSVSFSPVKNYLSYIFILPVQNTIEFLLLSQNKDLPVLIDITPKNWSVLFELF